MADIAIDLVVSTVAKFLIEEYAVLGDAVRHVEWIEKELRSMLGLLEQVEQRGKAEQEQALTEWAEKLKDVALDAKNVIETFVIKSVKRRRWGVLHWYDKYKVGKELEKILKRMRDVSHGMNLNTDVVSVTVQTPPPSSSSWSSTTTTVVAMEKLDHILSRQNLITSNRVIEMVEEVKDGLKDLQNIVSKLKSTNERETVWLEEVNEVCHYTAGVAGNFIARREKWLKMSSSLGLVRKVLLLLYPDASSAEFKKQMEHTRNQIGDALGRSLTFGVVGVGDMNETTTQRSTTVPVQDLSVEILIISELIPFSISYTASFFIPSNGGWAVVFLIVVISQAFGVVAKRGPIRAHKLKTNPKRRAILSRLLTSSIFLYTLIGLVIIMVSLVLPLQAALLLQLSYPLYQVIVWNVNLWRSVDDNLKCLQRDLNLTQAFLRDTTTTESQKGLMNERQKAWVGQLRLVAQNGKSLLDAAAAAGGGKGGCWSRRIKFAKDINCLLEDVISISHRKTIYGIANIIIQQGTVQQELVILDPMQEEREIIEQHCDNYGAAEEHPEPAASSYQLVAGLKQEVQSIRGEKYMMYVLFRDVLDMTEIDRRSRIWVEQMQGIAKEIGSVTYHYDTELKNRSSLTYTYKYWTRRVISKEIIVIRNKIEDVSRRRRAYGLVQFQTHAEFSSPSMVHILRGTTQLSLVAKESGVVGFDDDVHVLMAQLLSDEKRRCITSIVGIEGTGKTTLAKLIFEEKAVINHFKCHIWVSVPPSHEAQRLIDEIAKEATKQIKGDWSSDPVLETLANTKYLIVVDGIEKTSQVCLLDTLKEAIPDMSTGSRILLTCRNADVAKDTTFIHPLQLLDDESSWVLFTRHLKVDIPPELIKVGREIVMKCGGLPLQIFKMSCLLSDKDVTHEEWSNMVEGGQFNEDLIQSWSETLKAIKSNLPLYLTGCLFYFGLFPAEFGIPVRRLVALLVAEERVHHGEHQEPPEQVAERYLTKLIDQNLVQIAERKRNGKVKTCRLPYALRQLWWTKANDSIFLKPHTATVSDAGPKNSILRWVTDHLNTDHIWYYHIHGDTDITSRTNSSSLRTYYKDVRSFLSFDTREGSKPGQEVGYFMKGCISSYCFLLLRVLDLECVYKPKLPKSIARLSQLRYLGLRWTYLESLPSFISRLLKLQTLDLKHTYIHTLPHSIWEMDLRHLFLSDTFHSRFPPKQKDRFSRIRFFLPQLRDNFLHDLQTLWGLFVDEETPVKDGLDTLVNITKLGLACQQMSLQEDAMTDQLEAVADWIAKLENLQSLRLKSRDEQGTPWMLHLKLFQNNINLTDIYLLGILSSSSILSQFPLSLIELTLSHSKLKEDPMQILEAFPNLRTLCLHAESYIGKSLLCKSRSFPQLHVLKIWKLEQLEEWIIEPGALPCLRQLEIRMCPRLQMLPDGLKHVNTLLELKLTNMPMEINANAHNIPPNCQVI